jgi:hypothetical protein
MCKPLRHPCFDYRQYFITTTVLAIGSAEPGLHQTSLVAAEHLFIEVLLPLQTVRACSVAFINVDFDES